MLSNEPLLTRHRFGHSIEFGKNVKVEIYRNEDASLRGPLWEVVDTRFNTHSLVSIQLQGYWPSEPGEEVCTISHFMCMCSVLLLLLLLVVLSVAIEHFIYSYVTCKEWLLLSAYGTDLFPRPNDLHFSATKLRWTDRFQTVSRYTCPTDIFFETNSSLPQQTTVWARSFTDTTCNYPLDMCLIVLSGFALGGLILLAIKKQLRPLPYTASAPPLEKEEVCAICLQPCERPVLIRCKHRFCLEVCVTSVLIC